MEPTTKWNKLQQILNRFDITRRAWWKPKKPDLDKQVHNIEATQKKNNKISEEKNRKKGVTNFYKKRNKLVEESPPSIVFISLISIRYLASRQRFAQYSSLVPQQPCKGRIHQQQHHRIATRFNNFNSIETALSIDLRQQFASSSTITSHRIEIKLRITTKRDWRARLITKEMHRCS